MVTTLGPVAESVFALDLYARSGGPFRGWRRSVRDRLARNVGYTEQWLRDRPSSSELHWLLEPWPEPGATAGRADEDRQRVTTAMFEFCQAAVLPYWHPVRNYLASARDAYGRIEIANGMQGLLGNLHPRIRWNSPVLEAPSADDRDVYLDGRGLVISLSLFLHGRTCLVVDAGRETRLPALVVSVPIEAEFATGLWAEKRIDDQALSALVGHTRAAALEVLVDGCTTGELSQRLGISLAGASKHATVLRRAGLVTTTRNRNTALHTLTPLGVALLQNGGQEPMRLPA